MVGTLKPYLIQYNLFNFLHSQAAGMQKLPLVSAHKRPRPSHLVEFPLPIFLFMSLPFLTKSCTYQWVLTRLDWWYPVRSLQWRSSAAQLYPPQVLLSFDARQGNEGTRIPEKEKQYRWWLNLLFYQMKWKGYWNKERKNLMEFLSS